MPHNPLGPVSTAACIHLGAAVPNFAYLEDNFDKDNMHSQWNPEVFPKLLMRESTMDRHAQLGYPLPTEPGLGLEINEEALKALIRQGTLANTFVPMVCGTAFKNKGVQPLLDAVRPPPLNGGPFVTTDSGS